MNWVFYNCATAIDQTIKLTLFVIFLLGTSCRAWMLDLEMMSWVFYRCAASAFQIISKKLLQNEKLEPINFFFLQKVWSWSRTCTLNIFTLGVNKLVRFALKNGWQLYFLQVNCLVTTQWPNATKRCLCVNVKPECFLQKFINFLGNYGCYWSTVIWSSNVSYGSLLRLVIYRERSLIA